MRREPVPGVLTRLRGLARRALAAALFASAFGAMADGPPPPAGRAEGAPLRAETVKPGLHRVGGTLLRAGARGLILVAPPPAALHARLMAEIRRAIQPRELPAAAVVSLSAEAQQHDRVAPFVDAGVPVVVQRQAFARVVGPARAASTVLPEPFVTYGADYMLRVGDVEAEIEHVGAGRTGADSVVYFRDLRVIGVGELYTAGTPQPDCASGGSYAGWAAAIGHLLWFDFDLAVPSRGAPVDKPALTALKARLEALAREEHPPAPGTPPCDAPR